MSYTKPSTFILLIFLLGFVIVTLCNEVRSRKHQQNDEGLMGFSSNIKNNNNNKKNIFRRGQRLKNNRNGNLLSKTTFSQKISLYKQKKMFFDIYNLLPYNAFAFLLYFVCVYNLFVFFFVVLCTEFPNIYSCQLVVFHFIFQFFNHRTVKLYINDGIYSV